MAEHFHRSRFAGASQVNDASGRSRLPIELEIIGEPSPQWLMIMTMR